MNEIPWQCMFALSLSLSLSLYVHAKISIGCLNSWLNVTTWIQSLTSADIYVGNPY